jgi:hypothetical protein
MAAVRWTGFERAVTPHASPSAEAETTLTTDPGSLFPSLELPGNDAVALRASHRALALVSHFRSSHILATRSDANFGIQGTQQL